MKPLRILLAACLIAAACTPKKEIKTIGTIESLDPAFDSIVATDAKMEILDSGFKWSEGPVWVESQHMLLFSDIPNNRINQWTEDGGVKPWLEHSGFPGDSSKAPEPGSNGLCLDQEGHLLMCQHGYRRVAMLDAPLDHPSDVFKIIADNYHGKKLNSPNDLIVSKSGEVYFTDPPYGLPTQSDTDKTKELAFNGVYKVKTDGTLVLLLDSLTRPNGIGFSPDEKTLYVGNSDPLKERWYAYDIKGDSLANGRIFHDATADVSTGNPGAADGMAVASNGDIFATAPGGIWVFSPDGKILGKLHLPQATANCTFSADGKTLFITSGMYLLRLKLL